MLYLLDDQLRDIIVIHEMINISLMCVILFLALPLTWLRILVKLAVQEAYKGRKRYLFAAQHLLPLAFIKYENYINKFSVIVVPLVIEEIH